MYKTSIYLFIFFSFFFSKKSLAVESLSYSGRLVQANGAPVSGPVKIRAELAYTNGTNPPAPILCSKDLTDVPLKNGVFHIKLDFSCASGKTLAEIFSQIPAGESVAIQITDITDPGNLKTYSFQAMHAIPLANVASQLVQMNATDGQVLTWNDGQKKWKATTMGSGTVTSVTGTIPISVANGSAAPVVSISQATNSTDGYLSSADWNTFNNKQGALPAGGTSVHYFRGDNTWQTLDTSVVPENTNLYFTNARVLGVPLTGFSTATGAIVATDTTLQAFGKAQGQINAITSDATHFLKKDSADTLSSNVTLSGSISSTLTGDIIVATTPLGVTSAVNKGYVDTGDALKVNKSGDTMSGVLTLDSDLKIKGGSNYVTVKGHASSAAYNLYLPQTAGTAGYVLSTDGNGNTTWVSPAVSSASITDGSIVDADINASAAIAQSKIAGLTTDLSNKQPLITAGTNAQYFRGDKTFVDLGTDVRGTQLTGYSVGANSSIVATDTTLAAFQKIQGQIDATNTAVAGKEPTLTAGSTSQYYRGDKTWQTLSGGVVANTPAGTIAATNVQNAINELDSEKQDKITSTSTVDNRELRFYELTANGSNYSSFKSPDNLAANLNYVLPSVAPTAGQVLSSDASGVMSWITPPSAPVTTVFGRNGVVSAASGDYTATQITNTPAGTIAATDVQTALNELATEKEPLLTNPSDTTKYYRGDKTWSTFATDAINSVLSTFSLNAGAKPTVANTDSIVGAFGKVQKYLNDINSDYVSKSANNTVTGSFNISGITSFIQVPTSTGAVVNEAANVQYVQNYVGTFGQWTKAGSDIYRSSGNVGIGTTTPTGQLSLYSAAANSSLNLQSVSASRWWITADGTDGDNLLKIGGMGATEPTSGIININNSGNVGIGTLVPTSKLEIDKTSGANTDLFSIVDVDSTRKLYVNKDAQLIVIGAAASNNGIRSRIAGDTNDRLSIGADGKISWGDGTNSGDTSISRLASSSGLSIMGGNVGIGTTTPGSPLDVAINAAGFLPAISIRQTTAAATGNGPALSFYGDTGGSAYMGYIGYGFTAASNANSYLSFSTRTSGVVTEKFRIDNNGNVGIGTTGPSEKLEVSGIVKATSFISTSDKRLKKNIHPIAGLEAILRLQGYEYQWKANNGHDAGVLAQEVEQVFPYAVRTDAKTGFKAVNYPYLIAPLIESTKDMYELFKNQEAEMQKLKNENAELKERLKIIESRLGIR